jgi:hypothetical protein
MRRIGKDRSGLPLAVAALLAALAGNAAAADPAWELYSASALNEMFYYAPESVVPSSDNAFRIRERVDSTGNRGTGVREAVFTSEIDCGRRRLRVLETRVEYKDGRKAASQEPSGWVRIDPMLWDTLYGKWCGRLFPGMPNP